MTYSPEDYVNAQGSEAIAYDSIFEKDEYGIVITNMMALSQMQGLWAGLEPESKEGLALLVEMEAEGLLAKDGDAYFISQEALELLPKKEDDIARTI